MSHDRGPDDWPSADDEAGDPPRRRASDGGRGWFGRPLTLAVGWVLSCVLITAVTFTAVEHVGREVSGTQDLLSARGPQATATQSAAPSQPVASPTVVAPSTAAPVDAPPALTQSASPRASRSTKAPASPVSIPTPTPSTPTPTASPTAFVVPANAVEYVFTCQNGKAVGGAVSPSASPSASPSTSPSGSPSGTASSSPSASGTSSASPSGTPTPTSSPSTSKSLIDVPGGTILIACSGNVIANAKASTPVGSNYTLSVRSITDQKVDVFFAKN